MDKTVKTKKRAGAAGPFEETCVARENLLLGRGGDVGVFLLKALNAPGGVYQLLFAREEGVTTGANFNAEHVALYCGTGLERAPAGTVHGNGMIVGVNTGFHGSPICCGRSARQGTDGRSTAASLGHKTITDYTGRDEKFKIGGKIGSKCRVRGTG